MDDVIGLVPLGEDITVYTGGGPVSGVLTAKTTNVIVLRYNFKHDYQEHTILRSAIVAITRTYSKVAV